MDAEGEDSPQAGVAAGEEAATPERADAPFFERTDWWSFALTTTLTLGMYLYWMAPNVSIGMPAIFTVGAMYAGVPHPTGHSIWTLYAWVFTELLPFSNIAWRVGVSSAVAGALSCGCIALMASNAGGHLLKQVGTQAVNATALRIVASWMAGASLGFSRWFWYSVAQIDPWPLSVLLFCLMLLCFMRWLHRPHQRLYVVLACLLHGLTLTNSQTFLVMAPALLLTVLLGDARFGKTFFIAMTWLVLVQHALHAAAWVPAMHLTITNYGGTTLLGWVIEAGMVVASLAFLSNWRELTGWKAAGGCVIALLAGLSLYLYAPVASMTNPPVNWGYPRTVDGYSHMLLRGHYCRLSPTGEIAELCRQMRAYCQVTLINFGSINSFLAVAGFALLFQLSSAWRRWWAGLAAMFTCLTILLAAIMNPTIEPGNMELGDTAVYYTASYVVLAVWAGTGAVYLGVAAERRLGGRQ